MRVAGGVGALGLVQDGSNHGKYPVPARCVLRIVNPEALLQGWPFGSPVASSALRTIAADEVSGLVRVAGKRHSPVVIDDTDLLDLAVIADAIDGVMQTLPVVGHHRVRG